MGPAAGPLSRGLVGDGSSDGPDPVVTGDVELHVILIRIVPMNADVRYMISGRSIFK